MIKKNVLKKEENKIAKNQSKDNENKNNDHWLLIIKINYRDCFYLVMKGEYML